MQTERAAALGDPGQPADEIGQLRGEGGVLVHDDHQPGERLRCGERRRGSRRGPTRPPLRTVPRGAAVRCAARPGAGGQVLVQIGHQPHDVRQRGAVGERRPALVVDEDEGRPRPAGTRSRAPPRACAAVATCRLRWCRRSERAGRPDRGRARPTRRCPRPSSALAPPSVSAQRCAMAAGSAVPRMSSSRHWAGSAWPPWWPGRAGPAHAPPARPTGGRPRRSGPRSRRLHARAGVVRGDDDLTAARRQVGAVLGKADGRADHRRCAAHGVVHADDGRR